jgi:hypothetical protein
LMYIYFQHLFFHSIFLKRYITKLTNQLREESYRRQRKEMELEELEKVRFYYCSCQIASFLHLNFCSAVEQATGRYNERESSA